MRILLRAAVVVTVAVAPAIAQIKVTRFEQNPLVTTRTSRSLGSNVNGPTVIRVPDWVPNPLGRYYMYFANHMGEFIRLAYADKITGSWRIYEPGVLHVRNTAMARPGPDPKETLDDFYTHVASPEILIDHEQKRFVMWFHGWWTNGENWPADPAAARDWAQKSGYSQFTQAAISTDGLQFDASPAITRTPYIRVIQHDSYYYGVSRLGRVSRSKDPLASFELGPNPFRDGPYAGRIRHVALVLRGNRLHVLLRHRRAPGARDAERRFRSWATGAHGAVGACGRDQPSAATSALIFPNRGAGISRFGPPDSRSGCLRGRRPHLQFAQAGHCRCRDHRPRPLTRAAPAPRPDAV
jgi:hypothetical protein